MPKLELDVPDVMLRLGSGYWLLPVVRAYVVDGRLMIVVEPRKEDRKMLAESILKGKVAY